MDQIKRRIHVTENRIVILARDAKQNEDRLGSSLQVLYETSQVPPEAYLFSGSSSADLSRMDKYLYVLVEHHARSAKTYKHELASKRSDERKLVESSIQMHQSISGEEKNREKIRKLRNAEQAKLKSTVNQKAIYQRSIAEMEKRERLIQSLITKLERENRVPPFYFEIRHRGKPQDPLEWISRYKKGS